VTAPLARRLGRLEETRRRPIRELVLRIADRLGAELTVGEVEEIVARNVDTPERVRQWRHAGLSADQICDRLSGEMAAREAR
jgi:hypothetical protein